MENELLIHNYLDGTLDSASEEMLFIKLSSNEELRNEFRQQYKIKTSIKKDAKAFTTNPQTTSNIFSQLGIAGVLAGSGAAVVNNLPAANPGFWGFLSKPFISAFLTGFASVVAFILLWQTDVINFKDTNSMDRKINYLASTNDSKIDSINILKNQINTLNSEKSINESKINSLNEKLNLAQNSEKIKYVIKYIDNNANNNLASNSQNLASNNSNSAIINLSNSNETDNSNQMSIEKSMFYQNKVNSGSIDRRFNNNINLIPISSLNDLSSILNSFDLKGGFEFSGSLGKSTNTENILISEAYNVSSVDLRAGFYLMPLDNLVTGIDVRRENFYQIFNFVNNGIPYIYEQNPNMISMNAFVKYLPEFSKFEVLGMQFNPFTQVGLGVTNAGPVGRIMIGSEFFLSNYTYFSLGAEYSTLSFKQDNLGYSTDKFALQFSIGFRNK